MGVSRSDQRWAIVSSSFKCGPASGHVQVYKLKRDGHWRYLFYDMENDGCDRFKMPASVRSNFGPYVC